MSFVKSVLKGLCASVVIAPVLIFLFGYISYRGEDPSRLVGVLGKAALFLSAFIGGAIASKLNKENGLAVGLSSGAAYMIVVLLLSLMMREEGSSAGLGSWLMFLFIPAVSALGGVVALSSRNKRKKYSHKKHSIKQF